MTFKEIANRINGLGCPIFNISWTPVKLEIDLAHKVVIFLEDRRLLYKPIDQLNPDYCSLSALKIREFLTQVLTEVDPSSKLSGILRSIRSACRSFQDEINYRHSSEDRKSVDVQKSLDSARFEEAIIKLRATTGIELARLLVMHGIDCEGDLLTIIPFE